MLLERTKQPWQAVGALEMVGLEAPASILRAMEPDFVPLIANKPWPTTWSLNRTTPSMPAA